MVKKWEQITKEELERLYYDEKKTNADIAEQFGVSLGEVRHKRKKFGISYRGAYLHDLQYGTAEEITEGLNAYSKDALLHGSSIDSLSKAIAHYTFKGGPMEDILQGQLPQEDLNAITQYSINRLAGILETAYEGDWTKLYTSYLQIKEFNNSWKPAKPDTSDLDENMRAFLHRDK